jgi:hypothetical protein
MNVHDHILGIAGLAFLAVAVPTMGCGGHTVTLVPQVHPGPGRTMRPERILALSASCGAAERSCPRQHIELVDSIVRAELDFAGLTIVEPERLRAEARERQETHETERQTHASTTVVNEDPDIGFGRTTTIENTSASERETVTIVLDGSAFEDLTIPEQRAVLAQAGTDSVVTVRIVVGAQGAWTRNQEVEVMVKLRVDHGKTMAWASRCAASSNDFAAVSGALEHATRCAVRGGMEL